MPLTNRRPTAVVLTTVAMLATLGAASSFAAEGVDPLGDTIGVGPVQIDATALEVIDDGSSLQVAVALAAGDGAEPLVGLIEIDADGSPATGGPSAVTALCPRATGLGVDYRIDLFTFDGATAELVDGDWTLVGRVPAVRRADRLEVAIPQVTSGGESTPAAAVAVIVGPAGEGTDCIPDGGAVVASASVLEIPALGMAGAAIFALLLAWAAGRTLRTG